MVAPRKEDSNHSRSHDPPFLSSLAECKTEYEKEDGDAPHIHRTGCERLRAPIERHMSECLAEVGLAGSFEQLAGLRVHVKGSR